MFFFAQLAMSLSQRHSRGCQALGDDEQASLHYDEPCQGAGWKLWRCRVYWRGFARGNSSSL